VPEADARVAVSDRGYLYGDGVFETIRIHRAAPFRLEAHLRRMRDGFRVIGIEEPRTMAPAVADLRKLVEASELMEGLVRITATAPSPDGGSGGSVTMTLRPLPSVPKPIVLHVVESVRRIAGPLSRTKTIARVVESVALREARAQGAFDGLLLNANDRVVETTARNVFASVGGLLVTPPASEGALEGVTRAAALHLAKALGLPAEEAPLSLAALHRSPEVFLTGSGIDILAVDRIGARKLVPGLSAAKISGAYGKLLDDESRW